MEFSFQYRKEQRLQRIEPHHIGKIYAFIMIIKETTGTTMTHLYWPQLESAKPLL